MAKPIQALVPAIEEFERQQASDPEPMVDIFMMGIPMPLYKKLSDVAARQNLTFAQFVAKAFNTALEEVSDG